MKKLIRCSLIVSMVGLLTACCGCRGAKSKNPHFLTTDRWLMTEMHGKAVERTEENAESFTIIFDEKEQKVSGVAGCNNFFGPYEETPVRKIKIGPLGATRMMCPDMAMETDFMRMLGETDSYTVDGDMLMLQRDGEVIAIFQATPLPKTAE